MYFLGGTIKTWKSKFVFQVESPDENFEVKNKSIHKENLNSNNNEFSTPKERNLQIENPLGSNEKTISRFNLPKPQDIPAIPGQT